MVKALFAVNASALGALIGANVVAFVMQQVLGRGMSWFKGEFEPLILYGPAALCGTCFHFSVGFSYCLSLHNCLSSNRCHFLVTLSSFFHCLYPENYNSHESPRTGALLTQLLFTQVPERDLLHAELLSNAFVAAAGQLAGVGSSAIFFLSATSMFGALVVDRVTTYFSTPVVGGLVDKNGKVDKVEGKDGFVSLWTYALGQLIPLLTGTQLVAATLVVFVPLVSAPSLHVAIFLTSPWCFPQTGRVGSEAPSEFIIASLVAVLGCYTFGLTTPFAHRFGPSALRKAVVVLLLGVGVAMAVFARKDVFDSSHQKRLFVLHKEDVSIVDVWVGCKDD